YMALERAFDAMLQVYERGLRWSLSHRFLMMVFSLVVLVAMVPLFAIVPKGFMASEDMGGIFGITEAREGISFKALVEHQKAVAQVIKSDPNVESFFSNAGSRGGGGGGNQGFMFIRLKPRDQRKLSAEQVIQQLRPKLAQVIGINTYLQSLQPIRIGGTLSKSLYQFTLQDADTRELYRFAPEMEARMKQLPGLQDVTTDLLIKNPQVTVDIDRDKAASQGVTPQAIEDALYSAYGSRQISTIYAPNNEYYVILELAQEFQSSQQGLGVLLVMAILVIYLVLGILYESFIHPITILSALPLAGFGALVTLLIFRTELSIYAFVGIIMLVGLVKKNGIMMVDFAVEAQRSGTKSASEAIYEACVVRFRPIMMTTMAALVGTLPIAMGYGAGAESRRP